MAACVVMIMEALADFEDKFHYSIIGHSGQTSELPLVDYGLPSRTREARTKVIDEIYSHARSAPTGDKSIEAALRASMSISEEPADDYLVFLFSDANLGRYGVSPAALSMSLNGASNSKSKGFCILIAEAEAASWLVESLPFGRGFLVMDPSKLPQTFKEIFTHALIDE